MGSLRTLSSLGLPCSPQQANLQTVSARVLQWGVSRERERERERQRDAPSTVRGTCWDTCKIGFRSSLKDISMR